MKKKSAKPRKETTGLSIPEAQIIPRPPAGKVTFNHVQHWVISIPRIYRYEDQQHIDEFFATGRLRLSAFAQFAKYPDEQRGDGSEGRGILHGMGKDSSFSMVVGVGHGRLIFCASTRLSGALMRDFERNSVFEVSNPPSFAHAISRQLPGFRGGMEGFCHYEDGRCIVRNIDLAKDKDGNVIMPDMPALIRETDVSDFMLLKERRYQAQAEYRLAWDLDAKTEDAVFVTAPDARQFCRRVDPSEVL